MTGQIPKYGENFRLEQLPYAMGQDLASRRYVLKADNNYFIRSNRSSEKWGMYIDRGDNPPVKIATSRNTLTEAMTRLLLLQQILSD